MARLDFGCPKCGAEIRDRVAPAGTPAPYCDHRKAADFTFHGAEVRFETPASLTEPPCPMEILWAGCATDAIHPFEYEHDDGTKETITSLHRARQIERASEAAAAAGTGRLSIFRHLEQNSSNMDWNVFRADHPQVAREKLLRTRRGKPIISVGGIDISVHGDPNGPSEE